MYVCMCILHTYLSSESLSLSLCGVWCVDWVSGHCEALQDTESLPLTACCAMPWPIMAWHAMPDGGP